MSGSPRSFTPAAGFHFRTPLLPFDAFLAWSADLQAARADDDALASALKADRETQRERLRNLIATRELRDAIFVASPDLDDVIELWVRDPESDRGQRAERALVKYFSRAAGRPTPFGLFAGTSVGRLGDATDLVLEARKRCLRHSRLDMDYLFALADTLAKDPVRRAGFTLKPNSSLYQSAGHMRYMEARLAGEERTYRLVSAESSPELIGTLARASKGATAADLVAALVDPDVSITEVEEFVADLVDSQILVPDLGLVVTGAEPAGSLAARLSACDATRDVAAALTKTEAALAALDAEGVGAAPARYRAIADDLRDLPAKPELKRLFQVDLVKPSPDAVLGGAVLDEIARAIEFLRRILPQSTTSELAAFKEAFRERYESREVPLVDALDEESGIGFPAYHSEGADASPLTKDLPAPADDPATVVWDKRERRLLDLVGLAVARGDREIVLVEKDLAALAHPSPPPLPDAFAVMARVAARSTAAIATGDFRVRVGVVGGASGAVLLGRFCHADAGVRRLVEAHLRAEEALQPDAVFAEIVHLPEGRIGNILLRPVMRDYEIEFLGESGAPADRRLSITDLLVSLEGDAIQLRSRRLGRRVIPRLTSAHNFTLRTLGIYRFLCALQSEGTAAGGWSWGPLEAAPFLPRVTHGRLVLSPATWNLAKNDLERLGAKTTAARFGAVQSLRRTRGLPRFVVVSDFDNDLPVDLDAALSVESFVHLVKGRDQARLEEMFPPPDELCARGPEGRYTHEIVLPFTRNAEPRREASAAPAVFAVPRSFPPGSEWLYAKLYTGAATADRVLLDHIAPLAESAIESGAADRWFFIRYVDPREHLRVRFHGNPERLRDEVLPPLLAMTSSQMDEGAVWKVQLDTYEREIERYGGPSGIELAERLFYADSRAVVEILGGLDPGDPGNEERWRICLLGLDALLTDFGFDLARKQEVVARVRKAYGVEQREDAALRRALGERHRQVGREAAAILMIPPESDHPLAPGVEVLKRRSEELAPIVAEMRAREEAGRLSPGLAAMASSFMHMHAIRMFRGSAKRHEIVLYELLSRAYLERARRAAGVASA